ncbi:DUF2634 domain-containing protein [Methylomagnum ishizawai]|uniref:DUF2634 domain-containing protein n=1 Tax=Methylomagnum ishizawai TaxID=1760988 RepID=UPI001C3267F2|nr:DUF2634 domain-containing protein [Methylomagnum ishizawai]BBL75385.1 hypothetical protein MishRS11D_24830 [Methylomagnum ishizawai]
MTATIYDQPIPGVRLVELRHGESLQRLALRELGDMGRWVDIANLNGLKPPYTSDDPNDAGPGIAIAGDKLSLPSPTAQVSASDAPDEVFFRDFDLGADGLLRADDAGDLAILSGVPNLRQALRHALVTDPGELMLHPDYGCRIRRLIGRTNAPTIALLGGQYVRGTLLSDSRIAAVDNVQVGASGDVLAIMADARTVAGRTITTGAAL